MLGGAGHDILHIGSGQTAVGGKGADTFSVEYEGGATITLQGRGFQQGASVTVNDSYAFDVQVLNEGTEVRFTLPPATGGASTEPVTVVLINPPASEAFPDGDGQAATLAESFTYLPPRPVLLSVSPNKASVDGGTSITLSGSYMSSTHGVPAVCFGTQLVSEENISSMWLIRGYY